MIMVLILMMKVIGKYVNVLSSRFGNDDQDDTDHTDDDYNDYDDEYDDVSVVDGRERGASTDMANVGADANDNNDEGQMMCQQREAPAVEVADSMGLPSSDTFTRQPAGNSKAQIKHPEYYMR